MNKSRTRQAIDWIKETGRSQLAASREFGITQGTISRAMARFSRPKCPTCGHYLKGETK